MGSYYTLCKIGKDFGTFEKVFLYDGALVEDEPEMRQRGRTRTERGARGEAGGRKIAS